MMKIDRRAFLTSTAITVLGLSGCIGEEASQNTENTPIENGETTQRTTPGTMTRTTNAAGKSTRNTSEESSKTTQYAAPDTASSTIAAADSDNYVYIVELHLYSNSTVQVNDLTLEDGGVLPQPEGNMKITTIDSDGNTLFNQTFRGISPLEQPTRDGYVVRQTRLLRLPYNRSAERIQIFRNGEVVLENQVPDRPAQSQSTSSATQESS